MKRQSGHKKRRHELNEWGNLYNKDDGFISPVKGALCNNVTRLFPS